MVKQLVGGSGNQELYTPAEYIALVKQVLGDIDLDPFSCALANKTVQASRYYSLERGEDGYSLPWYGRLFINPPYGRDVLRCVQKLLACYDSGNVQEAIILLRSGTSTA